MDDSEIKEIANILKDNKSAEKLAQIEAAQTKVVCKKYQEAHLNT